MIEVKRSPSEIQIQAELWKTIWNKYPELRRCLYHVPNESTYDNAQQASSGVIPGIQDMHLLCNGRCWLIELKDDKGRLSDIQKVVHAAHKAQGFDTYVFRDADTAIKFVSVIANGLDPYMFDEYISEASNADMLNSYIKIWQDKRKARRKN